MSDILESKTQFPPPESQGGWRWLESAGQIQSVARMELRKLDIWARTQLAVYGGFSWSAVVVRHGHLVKEISAFNVLHSSRFDIWSGTKSFTATAWGLLLHGVVPALNEDGSRITLDSRIYDLIPEGRPLTDPRKSQVTIGQVLSMTGGFPGENSGAVGTPTAVGVGSYEHVLGRSPNRAGLSVGTLIAQPGSRWEYSDPGYAHLSLAFWHATGSELDDVLQRYVFNPIGIEHASWDVQGGGGFLGPHTNAHTGLHISARELARFGYLVLHAGLWGGSQIIPEAWQAIATQPSQTLNVGYGYGWWTNTRGKYLPGLPTDLISLAGFAGNRCYILPSLDLVVARVGTGPFVLDDRSFLEPIIDAVVE